MRSNGAKRKRGRSEGFVRVAGRGLAGGDPPRRRADYVPAVLMPKEVTEMKVWDWRKPVTVQSSA